MKLYLIELECIKIDPDTIQSAQWTTVMPDSYSGGKVKASYLWTTSGSNSGNVVWGLQGRSYGDGEGIDQVWGTGQDIVAPATGTANDVIIEGP